MKAVNISAIATSDGSTTFFHSTLNEHYHSINGAFQEAEHVYINSGLSYFHHKEATTKIAVLEIGFGTGLNYLLSIDYAIKNNIAIEYTGIEAFPLPLDYIQQTNYQNFLATANLTSIFQQQYLAAFETEQHISANQSLKIEELNLADFSTDQKYDIIYFDAFAASKQPEMWTTEMIQHVCQFLKDKGIFVTYSVTGNLKRCLRDLGFTIERPIGALGKREMMRATLTR